MSLHKLYILNYITKYNIMGHHSRNINNHIQPWKTLFLFVNSAKMCDVLNKIRNCIETQTNF